MLTPTAMDVLEGYAEDRGLTLSTMVEQMIRDYDDAHGPLRPRLLALPEEVSHARSTASIA